MLMEFRRGRDMVGTPETDLQSMAEFQEGSWPDFSGMPVSSIPRMVHASVMVVRGSLVLRLGAETGETEDFRLNPIIAQAMTRAVEAGGREGAWLDDQFDIIAGNQGTEPWRLSQYRRLFDDYGVSKRQPSEGIRVDAVRAYPMGDCIAFSFHRIESGPLAVLLNPVVAIRLREAILVAGLRSGLLDEAGEPVVAPS